MICDICKRAFTNKGGYTVHVLSCKKLDFDSIEYDYVYNKIPLEELSLKYNCSYNAVRSLLINSLRTNSESQKLSKKKNKEINTELKERISISMKKAHSEGRAYNIGFNKHKRLPSYPEQFFMKVIENEFDDKNYQREVRVTKYSIDFAWIHKMKAIEIDGQQHEEMEHKKRDKLKDECLKQKGWSILRIKWLDIYNSPKEWIEIAKKFLET